MNATQPTLTDVKSAPPDVKMHAPCSEDAPPNPQFCGYQSFHPGEMRTSRGP